MTELRGEPCHIKFPNGSFLWFGGTDGMMRTVLDNTMVIGRTLSPQELQALRNANGMADIPGSGIVFANLDGADWMSNSNTPDHVTIEMPPVPRLFADVGALAAYLVDGDRAVEHTDSS